MNTQDTIAALERDMDYTLACIRKRHLTNGGGGAKYHKRIAMRLGEARKRVLSLKEQERD